MTYSLALVVSHLDLLRREQRLRLVSRLIEMLLIHMQHIRIRKCIIIPTYETLISYRIEVKSILSVVAHHANLSLSADYEKARMTREI